MHTVEDALDRLAERMRTKARQATTGATEGHVLSVVSLICVELAAELRVENEEYAAAVARQEAQERAAAEAAERDRLFRLAASRDAHDLKARAAKESATAPAAT